MDPDDAPFRLPWQVLAGLERHRDAWSVHIDGHHVRLTNLDKVFWRDDGITKGDVIAYYLTVAAAVLPYVADRPLTMKRMPDGAEGDFFYAKQAPPHTPPWIRTAPVVAARSGDRIDYVVADDRASLAWLANLGCIELHPWHSRTAALGTPDYAVFDLDPFGVDFAVVRDVALHVRAVLDQLGLHGYPRTSGATGMQVYVPLDPVHGYGDVRAFVERCSALINRADPDRTTMMWDISRRDERVFLDHNMNVEGKNIAATWSLRPEPHATVATPLRWEEVAGDVEPGDFTIASVHGDLDARAALFAPVLAGGQRLSRASEMLGLPPPGPPDARHRIATDASGATEDSGDLSRYVAIRDFSRTPEPGTPRSGSDAPADPPDVPGQRFVIQHHLATRLHHDLRLERGGTLRSWAVPKGLPLVRGVRHLAVPTEDHPVEYLWFSGEIPTGQYGAGSMRIWDTGDYDVHEWTDDKVTVRLHGNRHRGSWHLFRTGDREPGSGSNRSDREPGSGSNRSDREPGSGSSHIGGQWMVSRADDGVDVPDVPASYEPMLATTAEAPFDDDGWQFEIKWDGIRAIATTTRPGLGRQEGTALRSRRGNDLAAAYPELAPLWERVLAWQAVLDGEIVALTGDGRPSFERLQRRMNVHDERAARRMARQTPVTFVVFDVLVVDAEDLTSRPLDERRARLDDLVVPGGPLRRSDALGSSGSAVFAAAEQAGLEGVIGKRRMSPYRPGRRSADWVKIKVRRRIDVVIGGWLPKADTPGGSEPYSLLVGLYDGDALRMVARVGSGLTADERHALRTRFGDLSMSDPPFALDDDLPRGARWVRPLTVCTVEYSEVTESLRLRAPTYQGRRADADADPRQCRLADLTGAPPPDR